MLLSDSVKIQIYLRLGELGCLERQSFFKGFFRALKETWNPIFLCELISFLLSDQRTLLPFQLTSNNMQRRLQLIPAFKYNHFSLMAASPRLQIQNVIYVSTRLHSLLQPHLSHSRCTLLNANLGPYWTRLKVQRAICHAVHCSRQNVERLSIIP